MDYTKILISQTPLNHLKLREKNQAQNYAIKSNP